MFGKQVLEVCTIVTYWVLFVPSLLVWLQLKIDNKPFDYFFSHSDYALYLILGYLVIYRIVLYIFIKLKTFDLRLWHTLPDTQAKLNLELEETKSYFQTLDHLDAPIYGSRILQKSAPSSPRPPRTPRLQRAAITKAELELELEEEVPYSTYYSTLDHMDGAPAILSYDTRVPSRRAPPSPRPQTPSPRTPPAINIEHVAEIYECPPE